MKYYIFIIFFLLSFLVECTSGYRFEKKKIPKSLDVVLQEVSDLLKKQIETSSKNLSPEKKNMFKLAVLPLFNENGLITALGTTISSRLITKMYDPGKILLVEKSQLGRLIDEQSFQKSGLVLSNQNLEIGRLSGADLILLGTVQFDDQSFLLQLRIVSLQSGEILAVTESVFDSDDSLYNQYRTVKSQQ
ncbi:CsgG/HfaB family protein [Leptospira noguchii]|uniref:FlgO family outer membrane protein n=1 Tax=Leptospira noguchii TaxID=28182 RepID=UPI001F069DA1|nr:FlgO family outer membrane protein [Leptospira noguchii]MCH1913923.1 CsgG/HfaB family protein [Leptospira noguchii]MCH1917677.1 CsgG/HfaB family protein [Leptospira noguchii]UOG65744.1 CsgG/HfaB family protein [Leptospira noguchii]